jgi:hypothetical protein
LEHIPQREVGADDRPRRKRMFGWQPSPKDVRPIPNTHPSGEGFAAVPLGSAGSDGPTCWCDPEEARRVDEGSGGPAFLPPKSLAGPALSEAEGLGMPQDAARGADLLPAPGVDVSKEKRNAQIARLFDRIHSGP